MTAVDFENFVAELATVAGEAIMPFFRTAIRAHDKGAAGSFDQAWGAVQQHNLQPMRVH